MGRTPFAQVWRAGARPLGMLALVLGLSLSLAPARAQDTPKEVRAAAISALSRGAFEEAIPALRQLIDTRKNETLP